MRNSYKFNGINQLSKVGNKLKLLDFVITFLWKASTSPLQDNSKRKQNECNPLRLHIPVQMKGCYLCIVSIITSIRFPFYHIVSVIPAEWMGSTDVDMNYISTRGDSTRGRIEICKPDFALENFSVNPENSHGSA